MMEQEFGFNVVMKGFISFVLDVVSLVTHVDNVHIAWTRWKSCCSNKGIAFKNFIKYSIGLMMLYNPNSLITLGLFIIREGDGPHRLVLVLWIIIRTRYL